MIYTYYCLLFVPALVLFVLFYTAVKKDSVFSLQVFPSLSYPDYLVCNFLRLSFRVSMQLFSFLFLLWVECSLKARKTRVQFQVESNQRLKKWYLISPCLTLSITRYVSRVKWSDPRYGVAPFATHRCSS